MLATLGLVWFGLGFNGFYVGETGQFGEEYCFDDVFAWVVSSEPIEVVKAERQDFYRVSVLEIRAVRRGPDGVGEDLVALKGDDFGLEKVGFTLPRFAGGGPRRDATELSLFGKSDRVYVTVLGQDDQVIAAGA